MEQTVTVTWGAKRRIREPTVKIEKEEQSLLGTIAWGLNRLKSKPNRKNHAIFKFFIP